MTDPREHRRSPAWIVITLVLAGGGCESERSLQIVTGRIERMQGSTTAGLAVTDLEVVHATAPLRADGSFVLAIPTDLEVYLAVLSTADTIIFVSPEPVLACEGGPNLDLGLIVETPGDNCELPDECAIAQDVLDACRSQVAFECEPIETDIEMCHADRDAMCLPLRNAWESCMALPQDCTTEETMLLECERGAGCEPLEMHYFSVCIGRCRAESEAANSICAVAPPPPCEPPFPGEVRFPELQLPPRIGCTQ